MRYPKLNNDDKTLYVTAPSSGVGHKLESFDTSLELLKKEGFSIVETPSVRNDAKASNTPQIRAKEFNDAFVDDTKHIVMCAAGGDFLFDMLEYVDYNNVQLHPKWVMGASDPTSLLYHLTVTYDIATMYGFNAGSFNVEHINEPYMQHAIAFLKQETPMQFSSKFHAPLADFMEDYNGFDAETIYHSNQEEITTSGRIIGGCIDCLKDIIGTGYDETLAFQDKYERDGIIFYFDNFAMSSEAVYRTLLQMKYCGWFKHTDLILFGRPLFKTSETGMTYEEAYQKALGDLPYIYDMDIGHTEPCWTIVNGSLATITYKNNSASISQKLV